jgi:hypothetical protein
MGQARRTSSPLHRRPNRRSLFDPYAAYVLSRWQAGVHDGQQLFEEIQAQGFKGTARLVRRFLQTLREKRRPLIDLTPAPPSARFSVRKREGERLDTWIKAAQESAVSELQSFVTGLLKDKDAVVAGLTLPVSQWGRGGPSAEA